MKVVLLLGPSSAGKSTICNELEEQGWRVTGTDLVIELLQKEPFAKKLEGQGFYEELAGYMSPEDVLLVCQTGKLNLMVGDPAVKHSFQFSNPDAPEAEDFIKQAGIQDPEEIKRLAALLRKLGEIHKAVRAEKQPENFGEVLLDRLFDEAFDPALPDEACVVIDIIPEETPEKTLAMIEKFESRASEDETERNIHTSIVLAVCSIDDLSERIQKRNEEAEAQNNPGNKRLGIFPFNQLTSLMRAKVQAHNPIGHMHATMGTVSRDQLHGIAEKHKRPGRGSPIMPASDGTERPVASKISNEDAVKISDNLEEKHLVSQFEASDGSVSDLVVRPEFQVNVIINTTAGTSKENAKIIIDSTEDDKKFHFFNK